MSTGGWKYKMPKRPGSNRAWVKAANLALSFGVTLGVSLYITYQLGHWLDQRLGTGYLITFFFVLVGVASSFRVLIRELDHLNDAQEKR